ncbi:IS982 family transposase [Nostoc sp. FACHB-133]|uniref:IS982 family transposase n=1 Tax=Nostoc sp. FACHB-133 TaxID=2692835 RepID=UPI0016864F0F|nr:IS982 family transposase [Nostoc sp. FACHB-133]MBD2527795.1 IS982 family transposase [Nostoc sp. FACHB-133]
MFSIEEFIIAVFCCVDDLLVEITEVYPVIRRGFAPSLSASEVMTMEIVAEYLGIDAEKDIWKYFHRHWLGWFPALKSRSAFIRQAANFWQYKQLVQQKLAAKLGAFECEIHLIDGLPMPLCSFNRAPRCRSFRAEADYGFCAAKKQTYYGFHGHLIVSVTGVISGFTLTRANGSEREALWDLVSRIRGELIGDKGYLSQFLAEELAQVGIILRTPLRSNMSQSSNQACIHLQQRFRRLIETVIGQLVERFNIEKIRARDMWHLTSRINRKILAHTLCFWLNRHNCDPLQFDELVTQY